MLMMTSLTVEEHNNATHNTVRDGINPKPIQFLATCLIFYRNWFTAAQIICCRYLAQRVQIITIPRPIIIVFPDILVIHPSPNMV
jgi:hypothetical protein